MKGYKVFNPDWTCRGFQYEVGKEYRQEKKPILCYRGFHFCKRLIECFGYYPFKSTNKVAEIEAFGEIMSENNEKFCTNGIRIVREITWEEALEMVNTGKKNTGFGNTGNSNSGNFNSGWGNGGCGNTGNSNDGWWNTGRGNIGSHNSGDWNSGNYNTGPNNSGDGNSGVANTGDFNTGDWNVADRSAGCFNTSSPKLRMFNKPTDWDYRKWLACEARHVMGRCPADPLFRQQWWDGLLKEEKKTVMCLPNFDPVIFLRCTGIAVKVDE